MPEDVEKIVAGWPCWEVGIYGFRDIYVEAPSAKSARWWTASRCHEAGYGRSPIDLIQRGITVREVSSSFAAIMGDVHRVKRSARTHLLSTPNAEKSDVG